MVNYQQYHGRPCGSSARGEARWLRASLEQEALRRGLNHKGTLDEICARLIAYDSTRPEEHEVQNRERRERQEAQKRERQETQKRERQLAESQETQQRERQEAQKRERQQAERLETQKRVRQLAERQEAQKRERQVELIPPVPPEWGISDPTPLKLPFEQTAQQLEQLPDVLGQGTYGKVRKLTKHGDFVVKTMKLRDPDLYDYLREVYFLTLLHGDPGVIELAQVKMYMDAHMMVKMYLPTYQMDLRKWFRTVGAQANHD